MIASSIMLALSNAVRPSTPASMPMAGLKCNCGKRVVEMPQVRNEIRRRPCTAGSLTYDTNPLLLRYSTNVQVTNTAKPELRAGNNRLSR